MDASLLMKDGPVEAYVESDLSYLTSAIMQNAAWLRFATAKRFLEWRNRGDQDVVSSSLSMSIIPLPTEGYAMARVGDHIDREERLARVRLAQWAGDMRRSIRRRMQDEREEFERVEHSDRIKWLVARLNEAISEQQEHQHQVETRLVSVSSRRTSFSKKRRQVIDRDPLGLVWVQERWGPKVSKSIVWIVEAGVVLGSGWVVWKYVVDSGLSGWFMQNVRAT